MVPPRKASSRRPPRRQLAEVTVEVADDGVHLDAGPGRSATARRPRGAASPPTRRRARSRSRPPGPSARASSRSRVFSEVPEPSSTSVSAPRPLAISPATGPRGSSARRGSGSTPGSRVISSKSVGAAVVVEPHRRRPRLRRRQARRRSPRPGATTSRSARGGRRSVDLPQLRPSGSRARRTPLNGPAGRRAGRSCGRSAGRGPAAWRRTPPRRTCWFDMNLPLYSPDRAGGGPEARVGAGRPTPSTPRRRRTAGAAGRRVGGVGAGRGWMAVPSTRWVSRNGPLRGSRRRRDGPPPPTPPRWAAGARPSGRRRRPRSS